MIASSLTAEDESEASTTLAQRGDHLLLDIPVSWFGHITSMARAITAVRRDVRAAANIKQTGDIADSNPDSLSLASSI
jgi:hypothetical protein